MKTQLFLVILCSFLGINTLQAQLRVGIEAGATISSLKIAEDNAIYKGGAGLTVDYTFANKIVLQSGLQYLVKGADRIHGNAKKHGGISSQMEVQLGYLELPVLLGYRYNLSGSVSLIPQIGWYFAYGIHGKGEVSTIHNFADKDGETITNKWDNPFEEKEWKNWDDFTTQVKAFDRFDQGMSFRLNMEISHFNIALAYDLGLKRIGEGFGNELQFRGEEADNKMRNRCALFLIGYKFRLP